MVDKSLILKELKKYKKFTTDAEFAQFLGISTQNLSAWYKRNTFDDNKIVDLFPEISRIWLLTGTGNMLKNDISEINEHKYKSLPVYNLDAVGGLINQEVDIQEFKIGEIPFVDAQEGDICIPISGDSMFPTYKPTTYVQIRKIENWKEYIEAGNIYVLVLNDGRRLIKEIRNSQIDKENYFLLHSHNPNYEQQEIPKKLIASIWIVVSRYIRDIM